MSYLTARWTPLSTQKPLFSWGYVDNTSNIDMAPYFSPYARNFRIDGGSIIIRPWHFLFTTLTAWSYPKGITWYLRLSAANDRIIARHNQSATDKLVSITSTGTVTAIATSTDITSNNKMRFINTNDNLYCMNWVDPYGKLNGTTYTTIKQAATDFKWSGVKSDMVVLPQNTTVHTYIVEITWNGTPDTFKWNVDWGSYTTWVSVATTELTLDANMHIKFLTTTGHVIWDKWTIYSRMAPSFGVMFNGSVFVAGSPYQGSSVFKSSGTDIESFGWIGSDTFKFQEQITWLSATTQGLFYFTKNSISVTGTSDIQDTSGYTSYITRVMNAKEWSVNHDSIVASGIDIYYITPNNNINKLMRGNSVNGYEEVELSQRSNAGIATIMQSLASDQSQSFGYFLPKENLIKRHLKSIWASFNDTVIVYDTIKDAFWVDTNKYRFDACVFNSNYYACSMIEPKIFRDEYSYADENSPIPFVYYTKEFFIWDATLKKILWETRTKVEINELAELKQEIWADWGLKDTKIVDKNNITDLFASWLGTTMVGTESVGTEWPFGTSLDSDMHEIDILRTKGNLNFRFKKVQIRWSNTTIAWKIKIKQFNCKLEQLNPMTTNLTE